MASMRPWPPGIAADPTASSTLAAAEGAASLGQNAPMSLPGHEDRQHVVAVGVEGRDDVGGRQDGDVVFGERPPNRMAMRGRESLGRWVEFVVMVDGPLARKLDEQSDCFAAEFRADHEIASCGRILPLARQSGGMRA